MPILRIRLLGDPILRRKCKAVPRVGLEARRLVEDMIETMSRAKGAGLAAPQVGVERRIIIVRTGETRDDEGEIVPIINPTIIRRSKQKEEDAEGCLSVPSVQGYVERNLEVTVRGLTPRGKKVELTQRGFGARVIQHEVDHLDGVLFLDKLVPESLHFIRTKTNEEGEEELVLVPTNVDEVQEYFRERSKQVSRRPVEAAVFA